MKITGWIRAHPYTTATPLVIAALIGLFKAATGASWWRCAAGVGLFCLVACVAAVTRSRIERK